MKKYFTHSQGRLCRNVIALFLSICLIFSESFGYAQTREAPFVKREAKIFAIPQQFGHVEESYDASQDTLHSSRYSDKTILFIQDAHDSLEAQQNIAKIIRHTVEHEGVKTVFEEGFEGPVPTDQYFGFIQDSKIKEKVSYFFMDKLRIGGAEYAHINRQRDFKLIGVDSIKLHKQNIQAYRQAAKVKKETQKDLVSIQNEIQKLAQKYFPKELKEWMKLKERVNQNQLSLPDYLKRIGMELNFKNVSPKTLLQKIERFENDYAKRFLRTERDPQIFTYYKQLSLLRRMNEIEITETEYEIAQAALRNLKTEDLAQFIANQKRGALVLSKRWETNLQHALQFYEIARQRDQVLEKNLEDFVQKSSEKTAVLVFGGFHAAAIKEILKEKGISYLVVTPKISSASQKHRDYYKRLMSVGYHAFEIPFQVSKASRPELIFEMSGARSEIHAIYEQVRTTFDIQHQTTSSRSEVRSPRPSRFKVHFIFLAAVGLMNLSLEAFKMMPERSLLWYAIALSPVVIAGMMIWNLVKALDQQTDSSSENKIKIKPEPKIRAQLRALKIDEKRIDQFFENPKSVFELFGSESFQRFNELGRLKKKKSEIGPMTSSQHSNYLQALQLMKILDEYHLQFPEQNYYTWSFNLWRKYKPAMQYAFSLIAEDYLSTHFAVDHGILMRDLSFYLGLEKDPFYIPEGGLMKKDVVMSEMADRLIEKNQPQDSSKSISSRSELRTPSYEKLLTLADWIRDGNAHLSWPTRNLGEISATLVPHEDFLSHPMAYDRLRVLVKPDPAWLEKVEPKLNLKAKLGVWENELMAQSLSPSPGTLGQILIEEDKIDILGAVFPIETFDALVIDEIQSRRGYGSIPQRFRKQLDLWRDEVIKRIEEFSVRKDLLLLSAPARPHVPDSLQVQRNYADPYHRLQWPVEREFEARSDHYPRKFRASPRSLEDYLRLEKEILATRSELRNEDSELEEPQEEANEKRANRWIEWAKKKYPQMEILSKVDLPVQHQFAYAAMAIMFGISGPYIETSKLALVPMSLMLLEYSSIFVVAPVIVALWLGSILRSMAVLLTIGPLKLLFGFKLRIRELLLYNFIPFGGTYLAVPAQILKILNEQSQSSNLQSSELEIEQDSDDQVNRSELRNEKTVVIDWENFERQVDRWSIQWGIGEVMMPNGIVDDTLKSLLFERKGAGARLTEKLQWHNNKKMQPPFVLELQHFSSKNRLKVSKPPLQIFNPSEDGEEIDAQNSSRSGRNPNDSGTPLGPDTLRSELRATAESNGEKGVRKNGKLLYRMNKHIKDFHLKLIAEIHDALATKSVRKQEKLGEKLDEYEQKIAPLKNNLDGFLDYLFSYDSANRFEARIRKAMAKAVDLPERNIIFVNLKDEIFWDLIGQDPRKVEGVSFVISHGRRLENVVVVVREKELNPVETLIAAAHEVAHTRETYEKTRRYSEPFFRIINEGYQPYPTAFVLFKAAELDSEFRQRVGFFLNRYFSDLNERDQKFLKNFYGEEPQTFGKRLRALPLLPSLNSYKFETRFVMNIIKHLREKKFSDEQIVILMRSSNATEWRRALGYNIFDGLKELFRGSEQWQSFRSRTGEKLIALLALLLFKPKVNQSFNREKKERLLQFMKLFHLALRQDTQLGGKNTLEHLWQKYRGQLSPFSRDVEPLALAYIHAELDDTSLRKKFRFVFNKHKVLSGHLETTLNRSELRVKLPDPLISQRKLKTAANKIEKAFNAYYAAYNDITDRAPARFQARQWKEGQRDTQERLDLYRQHLNQIQNEISDLLKEHQGNTSVWRMLREIYLKRIQNRKDSDLALAFFSSVKRRLLAEQGFSVEYSDEGISQIAKIYSPLKNLPDQVTEILQDLPFTASFENLTRDAQQVSRRLTEDLAKTNGFKEIESIQVLTPIFYRNKGAYVMARIHAGDLVIPLVLSLLNSEKGIYVDAVLTDRRHVHNLFSSVRANFHVKTADHREIVDFLNSMMPDRTRVDLYSAIGFENPAKIEFIKNLRAYLNSSAEPKFTHAEGTPGMALAVFTLPSFSIPYVFKVPRDRSNKKRDWTSEKRNPKWRQDPDNVQYVKWGYEYSHKVDRVGRMLGVMTYQNVRFDKKFFEPALLEDLLKEAPYSVKTEGDEVVLKHFYAQKKVRPLNEYLQDPNISDELKKHAVEELGNCIKDLAAAGIFVGDYAAKNFGVTSNRQVVLYDFDDLEELKDIKFKAFPEEDGYTEYLPLEDVLDPSYAYPEEFMEIWLAGSLGDYKKHFHEKHKDLYRVEYWQEAQQKYQQEEPPDFFPYPSNIRFHRSELRTDEPVLIFERLTAKDRKLRRDAMNQLEEMDDEIGIPMVIRLLANHKLGHRTALRELSSFLVKKGNTATPYLLQELKKTVDDTDRILARRLVDILGEITPATDETKEVLESLNNFGRGSVLHQKVEEALSKINRRKNRESVILKGTVLVTAEELAQFSPAQLEELYKMVSTKRSEVRLVIANHQGQIPDALLFNALLKLSNVFVSSDSADLAFKHYGFREGKGVMVTTMPKALIPSGLEAVALKNQPGVIAFAVEYVMDRVDFWEMSREGKFVSPSEKLLDRIQQEQLSQLVLALAA